MSVCALRRLELAELKDLAELNKALSEQQQQLNARMAELMAPEAQVRARVCVCEREIENTDVQRVSFRVV